jgi:TDG/mug DNA glycosylase family protein
VDHETIAVYEARARELHDVRAPSADPGPATAFAAAARQRDADTVVADLGCGPGWYTSALGTGPVVAVDGARAMLDLVPSYAPAAWRVQADLAALPFRRGALGAAWASKTYVHVARRDLPLALADLHRALEVDALVEIVVFGGDQEYDQFANDDFPGRRFSLWPLDRLVDVVVGAGFAVVAVDRRPGRSRGSEELRLRARRLRTLPDYVANDVGVLVVGLNPSLYAADVGTGFARPGNRFWPAALAAGLVTRDRDPIHAARHDRVGMTDLVKRATPRADELAVDEYRDGLARVERLVAWLAPAVVCFVGLTGWRAVVDRKATAGPQPVELGGRPVYVMPNTSGVNAHATLAALTEHLRSVRALAGSG